MSAPERLEQLQGSLERIVYSNEENHYTVAQLQPDNARKSVTIVGNLPAVQCGETLLLHGEWIVHPQFGRQFKIARFESILPSTITGLKKYLGSGLIRGIGPKFAERIVDFFGKDTLTVIDQYSGRLKEVPGIGAERAGRIRLAWVEQKAVREIMIFLQSYGVTPSQAAKIYKMYGDDSMKVVKDNPYQLARDIHGIGFRTADQIARNLGIPSDSAQRIQAGIVYQLEQILAEGHTGYPFDFLARAASEDLVVISSDMRGIDREAISAALAAGGRTVCVLSDSLEKAVVSKRYREPLAAGRATLVTPFTPDTRFTVANAMRANRYQYGLSDAAIIVESRQTGGIWSGADENRKHGWVPA
ncbi:MAG: DNA-processing protein DprA, partial [Verrucomicrobiae bacterium]|nr:DNA-processing protein DprA [Verrucomicrobiae bacterium]